MTQTALPASPDGMLHYPEDGAGAAAAPPTPEPSAAPATVEPAAPAATSAGTTASPPPPATGGPGEGWVPSYRLRETRATLERDYQSRMAQLQAEYETQIQQLRSQLQALVGVRPPDNPEVSAIQQQFAKVFPGLAQLEQRAQDLMAVLERTGDIETQSQHYWTSYGRQVMDRLYHLAESQLGHPLSDEGKRLLHANFVGYVQMSPETIERYVQDPSIVEEFWKQFASSFIEPARRVSAAQVVQRASAPPTPQDRGGSVPPVTPGPKPKDLDERAAMAWALYNTRQAQQGSSS